MQVQINKFEKSLLIFTLIDIFFSPYVFFLATTYSQFFVFLWFLLKDKKIFQRKELQFYYGILFFIALSVPVSLFTIPDNLVGEFVVDNLKRGLAIGMAISYYFFFSYMLKSKEIKLEKWMFAFLIYITLWGVLYFINTNVFLGLKRIFNPHDSTLGNLTRQFYFYRFNFIWTDPNNIGYTLVGVVAFLIMNKKSSNIILIISIITLLFNLLLIMSGGTILTALLIIPLAVLIRLKNRVNLKSVIMLILSLVIIFYLTNKFSNQFTGTKIGKAAFTRLDDKTKKEEPRLRIWKRAFESKNIFPYVFAGEGSNLFINGKHFSPHSGHLMFIFGYGFICYYMYMYLFFRKIQTQKWADLLLTVPFLACFTLNIGIGELKYAAIMYMLIAYSRIKIQEPQFMVNQKMLV